MGGRRVREGMPEPACASSKDGRCRTGRLIAAMAAARSTVDRQRRCGGGCPLSQQSSSSQRSSSSLSKPMPRSPSGSWQTFGRTRVLNMVRPMPRSRWACRGRSTRTSVTAWPRPWQWGSSSWPAPSRPSREQPGPSAVSRQQLIAVCRHWG